MVFYIMFFIFLGCAFVFNRNPENLFIFLASMCFFKILTSQKNYKHMLFSFLVSMLALNLFITFGFRNYFYEEDVHPLVEKEETLVLLVYEGEDKSYNIREISTRIYFENGLRSAYNMIYNLSKYKSYYEQVGKSEFKKDALEISENLKEKLGSDYIVMNTYLHTQPYFENMINVAIQEGYKDIIIYPMFISEGLDYKMLDERYEEMRLYNNIANITLLNPFDESEELVDLYVDSILDKAKKNDKDIGIILMGLRESNNLKEDRHIRESIKSEIDKQKLEHDLDIRISMVDISEDVEKSVQEFLEYGIDDLYVVTPTAIIENISVKNRILEIEEMVDTRYTSVEHVIPIDKEEFISDSIYYMLEEINEQ